MKYESNILLNVFLYEIAVFAVFKYTMKYIILSLLKVNSFINHKEEIYVLRRNVFILNNYY